MRAVFVLCILCKIAFAIAETGPLHGKAVICTDMAEPSFIPNLFYRLTGLNHFERPNLNLCTHLIYMDVGFTKVTDLSNPWPYVGSTYTHVKSLRKKYPHLKISVGTLNDANDLVNIASDQLSLQTFVKSALDFVLNNNLNGLNLYLKHSNGNMANESSVKANITKLIKKLSSSFKFQDLLLTATFVEAEIFNDIYDYVALSQYFEFMHFNNLQTVDGIIKLGVNPTKIILELNTKVLSDRWGQFSLYDLDSFMNSFKVFLTYNEICDLLLTNKVISKVYDTNTDEMVAHYIDARSNEMHSIRFESTRTLANKTRRAMNRNLGGVSITSIGADDAEGRCPIEADTFDDFKTSSIDELNIPIRRDATFPLLRTINQAILLALDDTQQPQPSTHYKIATKTQNSAAIGWDTILANFLNNL